MIEIREPNQKEIDEAKKLIADGYYQVSRKSRIIAKLPAGMTGKEALKSITPENRHYWVDGLGESNSGEHYLRCYDQKNWVTVSVPVFNAFRKLGGNTYRALHWESDEENLIKITLCEAIAGALRPSRSYRIELHDNCENCKHYFELWAARQKEKSHEQLV